MSKKHEAVILGAFPIFLAVMIGVMVRSIGAAVFAATMEEVEINRRS